MLTEGVLDLLSKGSVMLPVDALPGPAGDPPLKLGATVEGSVGLDTPVSCLLFLCFLFPARGNEVTGDDDLRPIQVPRRVIHGRNTTSHSSASASVSQPISHSSSVTVSAVVTFSGTRLDPNLNK